MDQTIQYGRDTQRPYSASGFWNFYPFYGLRTIGPLQELLFDCYLQTELNEEIGNLAAEFFLDFILAKIGPVIYNQAIEDAHTLLHQQIEELYSLQKRR